jgi:hypothetical protein
MLGVLSRVVPQNLLDLFMYLVIVELADVRTDNLIRQGGNGLVNYIETKAKCRHITILACKGTLQEVFV